MKLQNGGEVEVVGDALVVTTLRKVDDEGRPAPVSDEKVVVKVKLADVTGATFVRGARLDDYGAVVVHSHNSDPMILKLLEDDALMLVAELNPVRHVTDMDNGSSSDE